MSHEEHPKELVCDETYAIKILPFWITNPQFRFVQVEAQFATSGITAQCMMYNPIVGSLFPENATENKDLLLQPPKNCLYDILKQKLTERTAALEQCRLQQLFMEEELEDQKPTQLLCRRQQLLR